MFLSTMDTENISPSVIMSKIPRFDSSYNVIHRTECRWIISAKTFASKNHGEAVTSPKLLSCEKNGPSWQFKLYPHGNESDGYSSMFLHCLDEDNHKYKTWAYVKMVNFESDEKSVSHLIEKKHSNKSNHCGLETFMERSEILKEDAGFVDGGFFVLQCEVRYKKMPKHFERRVALAGAN